MLRFIIIFLFIFIFGFSFYSYSDLIFPKEGNVLQASTSLNFPEDHGKHPDYEKEWWNINIDFTAVDSNNKNVRLPTTISFSSIKHVNKQFNNFLIGVLDESLNNQNFSVANSSGGFEVKNDGKLRMKFVSPQNDIELNEQDTSSNLSVFKITGSTSVLKNINLTFTQDRLYRGPIPWGSGINGVCNGRISTFQNNDTLMYSIPNYNVTGTFSFRGLNYTVSNGKAWLDHKWFDNNPNKDFEVENWNSSYYVNSMFEIPQLDNTISNIALAGILNYRARDKVFYGIRRNANGTFNCTSSGSINSFHRIGYPKNLLLDYGDELLVFNSSKGTEKFFYYTQGIRIPDTFVNFFSYVRYYPTQFTVYTGTGFIQAGEYLPVPSSSNYYRSTPDKIINSSDTVF
jgi:hypothetical protein